MANDLIKTGISGFDIISKGGVRKKSAILISGSPGTGKTIACLQFLSHGAKKNENGVYITTEETKEDIIYYARNIDIDLEKYIDNKIFVIEKPVEQLKGGIVSLKGLLQLIKRNNIKRVVVDSLTFFEYLYTESNVDDIEFRRKVLIFIHQLKKAGTTILATSERAITDVDRLEYDMMDFLFDSFVLFSRVRKGSLYEKVISIIKMKGQKHSEDIYPIKIDRGGVKILYDQKPFSLLKMEVKRDS